MRDEYDFSNAVRGKYAARFHEGPITIHRTGSREDLMRDATMQYVADALAASQTAEFELFFLLSLEGRIERSNAGAMSVRRVLEGRLEDGDPLPDGLAAGLKRSLREFLAQRNWLVHECLMTDVKSTQTAAFLDQVEAVASSSRRLSSLLREQLANYAAAAEGGPSLTDLEAEARQVWLQAA